MLYCGFTDHNSWTRFLDSIPKDMYFDVIATDHTLKQFIVSQLHIDVIEDSWQIIIRDARSIAGFVVFYNQNKSTQETIKDILEPQ
jgi:hypothetical protein